MEDRSSQGHQGASEPRGRIGPRANGAERRTEAIREGGLLHAEGGTDALLITSQNGTAPKQTNGIDRPVACAITSQNGTAPKPQWFPASRKASAITSQNGTAPKLLLALFLRRLRAITSQNGTAPKL